MKMVAEADWRYSNVQQRLEFCHNWHEAAEGIGEDRDGTGYAFDGAESAAESDGSEGTHSLADTDADAVAS